MIRVTIRDINESDGHLLGDYPPSEVPALLELLGRTPLYFDDEHRQLATGLDGGPTQFVGDSGPSGPGRAVFEILMESIER